MQTALYAGSVTDVQGLTVGHAQNTIAKTGVTVVLADADGAVVSADVRGAAPGTRETDLCAPENSVERANAVMLAGGSAFGLAAATGVMRYLEEKKLGVDTGVSIVPIVPGAVVFDLAVGDARIRPDDAMGYEACQNATDMPLQGAIGAGTGASVGKLIPGSIPAQSGVGMASMKLSSGITVGAIVVCNACGDVFDITHHQPLGQGHLADGSPVLCSSALYESNALLSGFDDKAFLGKNTTIAVIATDAILTKAQAKRLATCAHDGFARAIVPVHTAMDGDTIFALATGKVAGEANMIQLCACASEVMARAICNAVHMGQNA